MYLKAFKVCQLAERKGHFLLMKLVQALGESFLYLL
jgi:hypothetical protein